MQSCDKCSFLLQIMVHSHGIRQTVDGKMDVIKVDESRMVKFDEADRECQQR